MVWAPTLSACWKIYILKYIDSVPVSILLEDNDVVTSPYNSVLSTNTLLSHADCVLPIDNAAIQAFAQMEASQRINPKTGSPAKNVFSGNMDTKALRERGFLEMNTIVARMLCHLTASSRFNGEMNVDMNEICTNLVPFPRIKFFNVCAISNTCSSSTRQ